MRISSYLLLSVLGAAVRGAKMHYYLFTDSACERAPYSTIEDFRYDTCYNVPAGEGGHRVYQAKLELEGNEIAPALSNRFHYDENCIGPGFDMYFRPDKCEQISVADSFSLASQKFNFDYYEYENCTGTRRRLTVSEVKHQFDDLTCYGNKSPSIRGVEGTDYPDIEMTKLYCDNEEYEFPHVNLNDGTCINLKDSDDKGSYLNFGLRTVFQHSD